MASDASGRPPAFTSFRRSQIAAFLASMIDYLVLIFLVEVVRVWYVAATALGSLAGGISNFLLGRYWSFEATHGPVHHQMWRYALISGTSMALNSGGVFLFKNYLHIGYLGSKVITSVLVGVCFNYPLHRRFVFR